MNQAQQQQPRVPNNALLVGPRVDYLNTGVPLYVASVKCNWKAAKAILDKNPDLVRYSITENRETPLHVAASAKADFKKVIEFVQNLVERMTIEDLELQNKNSNTALYLAAMAGNVETVKIMVERNNGLLKIPGAKGRMMPLYAAALFGNYDVVKYIFEKSKVLSDEDGWNDEYRKWLFEKCVENDMFGVALKIAENNKLPYIGGVLGVLARKPDAFKETNSNIMVRTINSVSGLCGLHVGAPKKESALPLLRFIWDEILQKPTKEISEILRGPPDSDNRDNKEVSKWAIQAFQLQEVIRLYMEKMVGSTTQGTNPASINNGDVREQLKKLSESLVSMHVATQKIIKNPANLIKRDNKPSNMEHLAIELQKLIFKHIVDMNDYSLTMINDPQTQASVLKKNISDLIKKFNGDAGNTFHKYAKITYSSRVLFTAAEMGNTTFLVELIRRYPDLIWKENDNGLSIFHVAAKHRHEDIYNILYEIGAMKDLITPKTDRKDNNMLHLVGELATQSRLEEVSGVALQMQLELLWFNEVKDMIPLSYREKKNADGLTPHELFTQEHKDLVTQGEKWMKGTSSQCMVVAALIATIVFAATFTVPGGYNQGTGIPGQTNGIPIFHSEATFWVFVVADAISLVFSSASILIFLSILTSRYAEQDYLRSLPTKLTLGLATLFFSITTMMVAFGVSFFVLYKKGLLWIPILICIFVVLPSVLYVRLQYRLFYDVIRSTYRSRFLFKPKKPILYYENPKV